ncbi:general secretion pathway protein GspB [Litoribacillus peritrichatus]|uniref:Type II secretion system protein GspB C-terminal domain-containing protein n=1 Tax=Litoribacillus peritrichatus TaxID=718191 RepID=A0ABP7N1U7_9GAMM
MSYILDALRKSEQERRNQDVVGSFQGRMVAGANQHSDDKKWLIWALVVGLVVINITVLLIVFKDQLFPHSANPAPLVHEPVTEYRDAGSLNEGQSAPSIPSSESVQVSSALPGDSVAEELSVTSTDQVNQRFKPYYREHYQAQTNIPVAEAENLEPEVIRPRSHYTDTNSNQILVSGSEVIKPRGIKERYREISNEPYEPKYDVVDVSSSRQNGNPLKDLLAEPEVIKPRNTSNSGNEGSYNVNDQSASQDISRLPKIRDLTREQQIKIPKIIFSSHLYSSRAESRSVRFGNAKYKEGDWLNQSLMLQSITEDGVIFNLSGVQFYMSSFEDWQGR